MLRILHKEETLNSLEALVQLACNYVKEKQYDMAKECMDEACRVLHRSLFKSTHDSCRVLHRSLFKSTHDSVSDDDANASVIMAGIYYELGFLHYLNGSYKEAIISFNHSRRCYRSMNEMQHFSNQEEKLSLALFKTNYRLYLEWKGKLEVAESQSDMGICNQFISYYSTQAKESYNQYKGINQVEDIHLAFENDREWEDAPCHWFGRFSVELYADILHGRIPCSKVYFSRDNYRTSKFSADNFLVCFFLVKAIGKINLSEENLVEIMNPVLNYFLDDQYYDYEICYPLSIFKGKINDFCQSLIAMNPKWHIFFHEDVLLSNVVGSDGYRKGLEAEKKYDLYTVMQHYIGCMKECPAAYERLLWLFKRDAYWGHGQFKEIDKDKIFQQIKKIDPVEKQIPLLLQCFDVSNSLGRRLWEDDWGGLRAAGLDKGVLKDIVNYLIRINPKYRDVINLVRNKHFYSGIYYLNKANEIFDEWKKKEGGSFRILNEKVRKYYDLAALIQPADCLAAARVGKAEIYYALACSDYETKSEWGALYQYLLATEAGSKEARARILTIFQEEDNFLKNFENDQIIDLIVLNDYYKDLNATGLNETDRAAFLLLCFDVNSALGRKMQAEGKPNRETGIFKRICEHLLKIDPAYELTLRQYFSEDQHRILVSDKKVKLTEDKASNACYERAKECEGDGEIDYAIANCKKAIEINQHCLKAQLMLARIYTYEKINYAEACFYYTQAIENTSSNKELSDLYKKRGSIYQHNQKKHQEAIDDFKAALALNPDHPNRAMIYFEMGYAYFSLMDYGNALLNINKGMEINPDVYAYTIRGDIYYLQGKLDQAASDYQSSISLGITTKINSIHLAGAYWGLGRIDYANNQFSEAIKKFDHVVSLIEPSANIYFLRACAYSQLGKQLEVINNYMHAIRLGLEQAKTALLTLLNEGKFDNHVSPQCLFEAIQSCDENDQGTLLLQCFDPKTPLGKKMGIKLSGNDLNKGILKDIYDYLTKISDYYVFVLSQSEVVVTEVKEKAKYQIERQANRETVYFDQPLGQQRVNRLDNLQQTQEGKTNTFYPL